MSEARKPDLQAITARLATQLEGLAAVDAMAVLEDLLGRLGAPPARDLFVWQPFVSHAGHKLDWKIECEALSERSWACLARIYARLPFPPFGKVIGIASGGIAFAIALRTYVTPGAPGILVADDVYTTGGSMDLAQQQLYPEHQKHLRGAVAFERSGGPLPNWVFALFRYDVALMARPMSEKPVELVEV